MVPFRGAQNGTYGCMLPVSASSYLELSQRANTSSSLVLSSGLGASVGFASIVVAWPEASVETTGVTVEAVPSLSMIESHGVGAAAALVLLALEVVDSARARLGAAATRETSRSRSGTSGTAAIMVGVRGGFFQRDGRTVQSEKGRKGRATGYLKTELAALFRIRIDQIRSAGIPSPL